MDGAKKQKLTAEPKRKITYEVMPAFARAEQKEESVPVRISFFTKFIVFVVLVTLTPLVIPHQSIAGETEEVLINPTMLGSGEQVEHVPVVPEAEKISNELPLEKRHELAVAKLKKQLQMNESLKKYLVSKRSPLAEYAHVILQQNNWKKILALANAESTMCRFYIEEYANCWGVGGENLWDMGSDLGEGIVAMNKFLNTSPKLSTVKYSQMSFEQMNGLYKQPARDHWVYNNLEVYNELTALEKSWK